MDTSSGTDTTFIVEKKAGVITVIGGARHAGDEWLGHHPRNRVGFHGRRRVGLFGTPILTGVTTLLTGNKAGFAISQYSRIDVFEVY